MPLLQYIARRIFLIPVMVVGITLMTFFMSHLVPSSPESAFLGERALSDPDVVEAFRRKWGLDRPLLEQYLLYLLNLARGDFGVSIGSGQPVIADLKRFALATLELATAAALVAIAAGIPLGVIAAVYYERLPDHVIRGVSLVGASVPFFWLALVALLVFWARLGWVPGPGRLDISLTPPVHITGLYVVDSLLTGDWTTLRNSGGHLLLPALVLASNRLAFITRITRSAMLDVLSQEYIRAARAKGLLERIVLYRHALRNALIPIVSYLGIAYGELLSGAIITETVFAFPGLGRYAFRGATKLDLSALMAVVIAVAIVYILVNLLVDVVHALADPRVRF